MWSNLSNQKWVSQIISAQLQSYIFHVASFERRDGIQKFYSSSLIDMVRSNVSHWDAWSTEPKSPHTAIGTSNVKTFLSLILQWSEYTGVKKQESDGHWIPTGESPTQTSDWLEQGQTWGQTASCATFSFFCPPLVVELHTESLVENTDMSSEWPTTDRHGHPDGRDNKSSDSLRK